MVPIARATPPLPAHRPQWLLCPRAPVPATLFPNGPRGDRLAAVDRPPPRVLKTFDAMPAYLLKPEVLAWLEAERAPACRLPLDGLWCMGARISEVLALMPASFLDDGHGFGVILKTLKNPPGPSPQGG